MNDEKVTRAQLAGVAVGTRMRTNTHVLIERFLWGERPSVRASDGSSYIDETIPKAWFPLSIIKPDSTFPDPSIPSNDGRRRTAWAAMADHTYSWSERDGEFYCGGCTMHSSHEGAMREHIADEIVVALDIERRTAQRRTWETAYSFGVKDERESEMHIGDSGVPAPNRQNPFAVDPSDAFCQTCGMPAADDPCTMTWVVDGGTVGDQPAFGPMTKIRALEMVERAKAATIPRMHSAYEIRRGIL